MNSCNNVKYPSQVLSFSLTSFPDLFYINEKNLNFWQLLKVYIKTPTVFSLQKAANRHISESGSCCHKLIRMFSAFLNNSETCFIGWSSDPSESEPSLIHDLMMWSSLTSTTCWFLSGCRALCQTAARSHLKSFSAVTVRSAHMIRLLLMKVLCRSQSSNLLSKNRITPPHLIIMIFFWRCFSVFRINKFFLMFKIQLIFNNNNIKNCVLISNSSHLIWLHSFNHRNRRFKASSTHVEVESSSFEMWSDVIKGQMSDSHSLTLWRTLRSTLCISG